MTTIRFLPRLFEGVGRAIMAALEGVMAVVAFVRRKAARLRGRQ